MNATARRIAGLALLTVLGLPTAAHADLWDLIWKMSGPQMIGFPFHCELALGATTSTAYPNTDYDRIECREFDERIPALGIVKSRRERRLWLSINTTPFFSTGKNPSGTNIDFEAFKVWMVAFEPLLEFRSYTSPGGNVMFHHGAIGASYDVLFGSGFDTFQKGGLKFKPVGVTLYRKLNGALTVRWYPDGFTPDEFGKAPPLGNVDRKNEFIWGFSFGYLFRN